MAVALLCTLPAATSAAVTVYVAVAVTLWPTASSPAAPGQAYVIGLRPTSASVTDTLFSATLPVLVTTKR